MEHLTVRDLRVLAFLTRSGGAKAYDIVRREGMPVGTVYNTLHKLIALGLAVKNDGVYEPTDKGRRFLAAVARELYEASQAIEAR